MKTWLKWIVGIIVLAVVVIAAAGMYKFNYLASLPGYDVDGNKITAQVNSFEECAAAGYPIMEIFPEQCSDGTQTFTRVINEIAPIEPELTVQPLTSTSTDVSFAQIETWIACDGLFPYTGNQGNSTFVDTTAGVFNYVNATPTTIFDGYEIRGCVRQISDTYDGWGPFEGMLGTYTIKDSTGAILISGVLTAELATTQPEIMAAAIAGDMLAFTETINIDLSAYAGQAGTLELKNDNASGEPQNDRTVTYNIVFD